MIIQRKSIVIRSTKDRPYFELRQETIECDREQVLVKVICFSVDPVMRVWLSGARTNFQKVGVGDVFNCFGLGVVQKGDEQFPTGSWVFGNTGTTSMCLLSGTRKKQCFVVPSVLVDMYGPYVFIYLINNGLAAYGSMQAMELIKEEAVLVSTAAGATGLLLCHLLKERNHPIIAITSKGKQCHLTRYTKEILNYGQGLKYKLKQISFKKYFDCVGEQQLDTILQCIENHGIIALCGASASYSQYSQRGIANYQLFISKRVKAVGVNFVNLMPQAKQIFASFARAQFFIKTISLHQFQQHFAGVLTPGRNIPNATFIVGKIIVKL